MEFDRENPPGGFFTTEENCKMIMAFEALFNSAKLAKTVQKVD